MGCSTKAIDGAAQTPSTLVRAHSFDAFEEQFKSSFISEYGTFRKQARSEFMVASSKLSAPTWAGSYSQTPLQHNNVDEADRLKTDGKYIYISTINGASIKIFNVGTGTASPVSQLALAPKGQTTQTSGLYLLEKEKQLVAVVSGTRYFQKKSNIGSKHLNSYQKTDVTTVDISTPATPKKINQLSLNGRLISSRRIGSTLYVATRHTAKFFGLINDPKNHAEAAFNRRLIANTSITDLLPKYEINNKQYTLFDAQDCFYTNNKQPRHSQHSIISLVAIDLNKVKLTPKGQCYIGDTETVYASANAVYLATTQYRYTNEFSELIYEGSPTTEIHKFSLKSVQPNYVGSASIDGHFGWRQSQKPWRMSEENGILRVISYVGKAATSEASPARLHVLKESKRGDTLEVIATLPNKYRREPLGKKGEQIYASRFMGNRGYLVTFKATDPLYVLDLSDPTDPHILGALEVDGYSDHLLPIGENLLLGIGKDAVATKEHNNQFGTDRGAWYQGVKLSLIDISDPAYPVEKQKIILGKRGTNTAVSASHHALTTLQRGNSLQVNLPVSLHDRVDQALISDLHPSDYFKWTRDALYRLNIDIDAGKISMLKPIIASQSEKLGGNDFDHNRNWRYDRSAIIGGNAYYLKRDEIYSSAD